MKLATVVSVTAFGCEIRIQNPLTSKDSMKTSFGKMLMLVALTPCICLSAWAYDVSLNFSGVVTSVTYSGPQINPYSVGDVFTGVLSYNLVMPDLNPDPSIGEYRLDPYGRTRAGWFWIPHWTGNIS